MSETESTDLTPNTCEYTIQDNLYGGKNSKKSEEDEKIKKFHSIGNLIQC